MPVITSPNMSLPVPVVGQEIGPQYAIDVNNALFILDQHNHSPGSGVQITPAGLNINSALTLQNNFLTNSAGMTLTAQTSMPANNTVYESGTDLYFVDGLGNNVRLTQNGAVAGTPGSIGNLTPPATVTYNSVSKTFVFQSGTGIAANIDAASYVFRNISPNSTFGVTLNPPAALGVDYSLTLPTLPSVTSFMTLDTAGNMAANTTVDGSTIVLNSNQISVGTITDANIASGTITADKFASTVHGLSINPNTASFTTAGSTSWSVPAGVTRIIVLAVGAGGGGGGGGTSTGGASTAGSTGGNTLFNGNIVGYGGNGGGGNINATGGTPTFGPSYDFYTGGNGGNGPTNSGLSGMNSQFFAGGGGGNPNTGAGGSGGGASSFAVGGAGGNGSGTAGAAGTLGSGGGGGGATSGGGGGAGGNGARASISILAVTPSASIPIVIGAGGAGGGGVQSAGGAGGDGALYIYW